MQDAYEETQSRQINDAMDRSDARIGMAQLRNKEREFLIEFPNLKDPAIKAIRTFFTDADSFGREHGRLKAATTLAGILLKDEPRHHSIAPKLGEDGISANQRDVATQALAQRLANAASKREVKWFAQSVAEQARAK